MTLILSKMTHEYQSPSSKPRKVLDTIEWHVETGTQILLRGVSGSGKTTLFNIIAGLMQPTNGSVRLNNTDLYQLSEAKRDRFRSQNIGYVFQTHYLLNTLTAIENVIMPMAFSRSISRNNHHSRAALLLQQVGLGGYLDYRPSQLSTGQRMRVAVARALANTPKLLLADEPTAALDDQSADQVMDLIQQQAQDTGATLIVSSHDPALLTRFSTIANLEQGHLTLEEGQLS